MSFRDHLMNSSHFSSHMRWALALLVLSGCGEFKATTGAFAPKKADGPVAFTQIARFNPESEVVNEAELDTFVVKMFVPASFKNDLWFRRIDKSTEEFVDAKEPDVADGDTPGTVMLADVINLKGLPRTLREFEYVIYSGEKEVSRQRLTIKPTVYVKGTQTLDEAGLGAGEFTLGSLYFAEGARLITNGRTIVLNVDKLVARSGTIETFTEEEAAKAEPTETRGRSGGVIKIAAQEATGNLSIKLRGTKGGQGERGVDATGEGAKGADSVGATFVRLPFVRTVHCDKPGTPAQQGEGGPKGGTSRPGSPGGSTGFIDLRVAKSTDAENALNVDVKHLPGPGGDPGEGGRGGPGGPGGQGIGEDCNHQPYPGRERGPEGPRGDQAAPGPKGAIDRSCVVIAPNTFCQGLGTN